MGNIGSFSIVFEYMASMNYTFKKFLILVFLLSMIGTSLFAGPIEIKQFEIRTLSNFVDISWVTSNELDCNFFYIERSRDGKHYVPVGRIEAKGTHSGHTYYDYTDWDAPEGMLYYRLISIDNHNSSTVHPIVIAGIRGSIEPSVEVRNQMTAPGEPISVLFNDAPAQDVNLQVLDLYGNVVANQSIRLQQQGSQAVELECTMNLARGPYVLAFNSKNFEAAEPILVH